MFPADTPVIVVVTATPTPPPTTTSTPAATPTAVVIVVTATATPPPTATPAPTATPLPPPIPIVTPPPTQIASELGPESWSGLLTNPDLFRLDYRGGAIELDGYSRDEGVGTVERVRAYGGLSSDFVRAFGFVQANLSSDLEIRVDALVLILDIPSRIHWQIEFNDLPLFTDADNAEREEYGDDSFLYFWNVYPEDIRWGHLESVELALIRT